MAITVSILLKNEDPKQPKNVKFSLCRPISVFIETFPREGKVHDFSGEVHDFSGEVQNFSGEAQNDLRGGAHLPSKSGHESDSQLA
jgi:hypothetical protein